MNRSKAFTLIELLVVIAIMAVLMALILPGVAKARRRATAVKCAAHLRQVGIGVRSYLTDHDNFFPPVLSAQWDKFGWISGTFYLPYVNGEYSLFRCPGQGMDLSGKANLLFPSNSTKWTTYEFNSYRFTRADTNSLLSTRSRDIETPTLCPYMYDYPYYVSDIPFPHQDGMNVLYVDSHVAWKPIREYLDAQNNVIVPQFYMAGFPP